MGQVKLTSPVCNQSCGLVTVELFIYFSVTLLTLMHTEKIRSALVGTLMDKVKHITQMHFALWCHEMEIFSALLALCAGNSPVTGKFPALGQWRGALVFSLSLICAWINFGRVNNREAGDLRRHRACFDVVVMGLPQQIKTNRGQFQRTYSTL